MVSPLTIACADVMLRVLGWDVCTAFYVPRLTLAAIAFAVIALIAIGVLGRRRLA